MDSSASGRFVSIDGPSAVGKTTACRNLLALLERQGLPVLATTTPSPTDLGAIARAGTHHITGHALSCLVAADRYHHRATVVDPALERHAVVLCDRYVASAFVLDRIDGVGWPFVSALYSELPVPDLAIVLVADPAMCAARARARGLGYSRFHSHDLAWHQRERSLFIDAVPALRALGHPVHQIDIGNRDPAAVADLLAAVVLTVMLTAREAP